MSDKLSEQFTKLQSRAVAADRAHAAFCRELRSQYGQYLIGLPRGKESRKDRLSAAADKARDAYFEWLDQHSPRDWRHGVPYYWTMTDLSYADAVTFGELSTVPPAPWGRCPSDMVRFARPVEFTLATA